MKDKAHNEQIGLFPCSPKARHLSEIKAGGVLHKDALFLQLREELAPREIVQNQIQLAVRLECVVEAYNKGMLDLLQNATPNHAHATALVPERW